MGNEKHTPTPWAMHKFITSMSDDQPREALRCVGKSMTGRDWTCYIESAGGVTVLQTDGETEAEAIANAQLVLRAVNAHNALVGEVKELRRMLQTFAPMVFTKEVIPHLPGNLEEETKAWLRGTRTEDVLRLAEKG